MLKATISNLQFFENFLSIINKFVQQCQFELTTDGVNVYCKNKDAFPSARLLLDSNVIKLNEGQAETSVKICVRDVIAFKSAVSIIQQVEDVKKIEIELDDVKNSNETLIKSIKYKSSKGVGFNLITIDFDVIKNLVSKDSTTILSKDWSFNINPLLLEIAQNRTSNIVNLNDVGIYLYPDDKKNVILSLKSEKSALFNSIDIPIAKNCEGSLENFTYDKIAVSESSFKIFNILKTVDEKNLECFFNFDNNVFFIESKLLTEDKDEKLNIHSRLFVQMIKGK